MAKKKVTVNVEESVWLEFKKRAFRSQLEAGQNPSVSQYLENMISVKLTLPIEARYEHKDLVTEIPVERIKDDFINALADEDVDLEAEELKQANERLLKKRSQIKGAIKTSSDIPDRYRAPEFTGGVPKAKWKGAK